MIFIFFSQSAASSAGRRLRDQSHAKKKHKKSPMAPSAKRLSVHSSRGMCFSVFP